jgi:hypothetical protein
VFVSVLRPRNAAMADLELLRLRYLAGALAEPSALSTGVSVPPGATVPLSLDRDGLLYLAVPADAARGPYSATVLSFDQDGRVPAGRRAPTPVIAAGLDQPGDLAWDDQAGVLWLAGRNDGTTSQVLAVSQSGAGPGARNVLGPADEVSAIAVSRGHARRLLVGTGVDLIEATPDGADVQRIPLDQHGEVVAVASLPGGASIVAVRRADVTSEPTFGILKVEAGGAVLAR